MNKNPNNLIINRDEKAIYMSRVFEAVPERVWRIYTDPALIAKWWGPRSLSTRVDKMDVQVGGQWRFIQQDAEGNEYAFRGEFKVLDAPHRLVMTFEYEGMPGHIVTENHHFESVAGGKTKLTTRSVFETTEALEGMVQSGMESGAVETWDRMEELLEKTVTSNDGTIITFDQIGSGPSLILVGGLFEQRASEFETAKLAALPLLSQHFTVFHYDRRGRGDSTNTLPFTVEREIEDIDALIHEAGGSAFLFGISSGAALAFEAALALGGKVKKLAMYEPPYNDDEAAQQAWRAYRKQLKETLAANCRGEAVGLFMALLGATAEQIEAMHQYPMWAMWEAIAPTMEYDAAALGEDASVPVARARRLAVPTLVMDGGASFPFMHTSAVRLAAAISQGQQRTLEGQTHEVDVAVLAPLLIEFFAA